MKLTDGKRTVAITMFEWNGEKWKPDWSLDFFNTGEINYNDEVGAFIVENIGYCIEQAMDWKYNRGDYEDEAEVNPEDRLVSIEIIKDVLQYAWYKDTDYKGFTEQHKLYRGIPEIEGGWLMQTRGVPIVLEMLEGDKAAIQEVDAILSDDNTEWMDADEEDYQYVSEWLDIWNLK